MVSNRKPSITVTKSNIAALYWNPRSKFGITSKRVTTVTRQSTMQAAARLERESRASANSLARSQAPKKLSPSLLSTVGPSTAGTPARTTLPQPRIQPFHQVQQIPPSKPPLLNLSKLPQAVPSVIQNVMGNPLSVTSQKVTRQSKNDSLPNGKSSTNSLEVGNIVNETLDGLDEESLFGDF